MSGFDEQVFEFGDGALFESETERGDGEADDVVAPAGDRDPGAVCVQQDGQIVTKF